MSAEPNPQSVSPSMRARSLPLAGTVSRWPARMSRWARPRSVRATTLSPTRSTVSQGDARRRASTMSANGPSARLGEAMSTSSAVARSRSVMPRRSCRVPCAHQPACPSDRGAVITQDVVELGLVVAFTGLESFDDQDARQTELATGEGLRPRRRHRHAPRRHLTPSELVAGLGVDDGDRPGEDAAGTRGWCRRPLGRPRPRCIDCRSCTRRR